MTSRFKFLKTSIRYLLYVSKPVPKMEEVKKQVFVTFGSGFEPGEKFEKNLNDLMSVMSKLSADDVRLDTKLLLPKSPEDAPVTYIDILEHPRFTINMFVLRPGSRLPLHDHPNMYGICKVVKGKVTVRNMTLRSTSEKGVVAEVETEGVTTEDDRPLLLTPTRGNIHEIKALDEGAAFVDVLAPPYHSNIDGLGPRPCNYFLEKHDSKPGDLTDLKWVDRVSDYYTDFAPYLGD